MNEINAARRMRVAAVEKAEAQKVGPAEGIVPIARTASPRCMFNECAHFSERLCICCAVQIQLAVVKAAEAEAEAKFLHGQGIARQRQVSEGGENERWLRLGYVLILGYEGT